MIRSLLSVFAAFVCTFFLSLPLHAQNFIHNWQFDDTNGTQINAASNDGTLGTTFNFGGPRVQKWLS